MKKLVATIFALFGITCCVAASYAAAPRDAGRTASFSPNGLPSQISRLDLIGNAERSPDVLPVESRNVSKFDYSRLAYRISYAGAILLTADHVIRSVDSLLDSMEYTTPDGTSLHFVMEPKSKGFEVMLKMSRPLAF